MYHAQYYACKYAIFSHEIISGNKVWNCKYLTVRMLFTVLLNDSVENVSRVMAQVILAAHRDLYKQFCYVV